MSAAEAVARAELEQAHRFLELLDPEAEAFTFQIFDDSELKRRDLAKVFHGSLADEAGRLEGNNRRGGGIFVTINETDGMGRKETNITRVRAVFVDLDGAPLDPVMRCNLEPDIVVESSPGRWHCYWLVDGLPLEAFTPIQKAIAGRFNGDPAVNDLPRVMRLPGFLHRKGEPFMSRIIQASERMPYGADQILAEFPPVERKANGEAEVGRHEHGGVDLEGSIAAAARPGNWHATVRDAVASMVSRGMPDDVIQLACRTFTLPGYTAEQTRRDVQKLIDGARGKGWGSEQDQAWPDPLGEMAFHGLAGEAVRILEPHSEADAAALLIQFLAAFGNACGRGAYMQVEGDQHPAQLWTVLVGETAKARKGTSWGRIRQVFDLACPYWAQERIVGGLSSGEGVIWATRDRITKRVKEKKTGDYEEEEVDPGVPDKRLLVLEAEFASPLRHFERQGNTLSGTLRQLWDRGDVASLTKNSPARTTGSMVSIIGHITVEELRRYLTRTEAANGLANRFLFVCARRARCLPFGGGAVDLEPLAEKVADRLGWADARGEQRIGWTDAAREIWQAVYPKLSEGKPGLFGAVTSRAETQTLRLALAHALLDRAAFIDAAHLRAALEVWRYCDQSAAFVFGTAVGDPVADDIRRALATVPDGMTRNDIRNLFSRNQSSEAIGRALEALASRGLARCETKPTGGRPEERWFAQ